MMLSEDLFDYDYEIENKSASESSDEDGKKGIQYSPMFLKYGFPTDVNEAKKLFDDKVSELDCMSEDTYKAETLRLQLLRDFITENEMRETKVVKKEKEDKPSKNFYDTVKPASRVVPYHFVEEEREKGKSVDSKLRKESMSEEVVTPFSFTDDKSVRKEQKESLEHIPVISQLMERRDRIDDLMEKSERLSVKSHLFYKSAKKLQVDSHIDLRGSAPQSGDLFSGGLQTEEAGEKFGRQFSQSIPTPSPKAPEIPHSIDPFAFFSGHDSSSATQETCTKLRPQQRRRHANIMSSFGSSGGRGGKMLGSMNLPPSGFMPQGPIPQAPQSYTGQSGLMDQASDVPQYTPFAKSSELSSGMSHPQEKSGMSRPQEQSGISRPQHQFSSFVMSDSSACSFSHPQPIIQSMNQSMPKALGMSLSMSQQSMSRPQQQSASFGMSEPSSYMHQPILTESLHLPTRRAYGQQQQQQQQQQRHSESLEPFYSRQVHSLSTLDVNKPLKGMGLMPQIPMYALSKPSLPDIDTICEKIFSLQREERNWEISDLSVISLYLQKSTEQILKEIAESGAKSLGTSVYSKLLHFIPTLILLFFLHTAYPQSFEMSPSFISWTIIPPKWKSPGDKALSFLRLFNKQNPSLSSRLDLGTSWYQYAEKQSKLP